MKSSDLQAMLDAHKEERAQLLSELDDRMESFRTELPKLAEAWIRSAVRHHIEGNAAQVTAVGPERLARAKSELEDLVRSLPEFCKSVTSDKSRWPHNVLPVGEGAQRRSPSDYFGDAFRAVISNLGDLLAKHELLAISRERYPTWEKLPSGKYRYAINPGLDQLKPGSISAYEVTRGRLAEVDVAIGVREKEIVVAKAREMWESV
jgi:hypothetical protein